MTSYVRGSIAQLSVSWVAYVGGPAVAVTGVTVGITTVAGAVVLAPTAVGVSNPSTGLNLYSWSVPIGQTIGDYTITWSGTNPVGGGTVVAYEVVTVVSAPASAVAQTLITTPYLTPATFRASPTAIDSGVLNVGSVSASDQDAELYNQLLKASAWASNAICNMPLHAHYGSEQLRLRADRQGLLKFSPTDTPVRLITAFGYGYSPGSANLRAVSDLSQQWIEADRLVIMPFGPMSAAFGQLEFGPRSSSELYTSWTYLAGYPVTLLAGAALAGATLVQVSDPTGILPGDTLRIWTPGKEEAVTVAGTYVTGSTTVNLTAGLTYAHAIGDGISAMPPDIIQAVTNKTVAQLMRPDSTAEDQYPDGPSSSTRSGDARKSGSGLIAEARELLSSYRRVR